MSAHNSASELARRLARDAEAACRHYLPNGRREGNYWLVGDVLGARGRSLYVRLKGPESGKGAAGKWTDSATAEHGDLLDLIRLNRGFLSFRDVRDEAAAFLKLPRPPSAPAVSSTGRSRSVVSQGSVEAARRLFAASKPLAGTLAEDYLRRRGITALHCVEALRFHPRCFYHLSDADRALELPAMIAAVTDGFGAITGVHRTFLDSESGKAPVGSPRRAMGHLLGFGVRFAGEPGASLILVAGEGIETTLSLRMAMPSAPMIAALSANHLSAILFPPTLQRLYIAVDRDAAGRRTAEKLNARCRAAGVEVLPLLPELGDFNDDLRHLGLGALRESLQSQLVPEDAERLLSSV